MLEELSESYKPKEFLHREEQINQLRKIFSDFKQIKYSANHLVSGKSGSGKTSIIKSIINEMDNSLYISLAKAGTTRAALATILNRKKDKDTATLKEMVIKELIRHPRVLVLDEVHKIQDFENLMDCLNDIYRDAHMPIIIISNKFNFISEMPEDALLTLMFMRLDFPIYNAIQLRSILDSRLKLIKEREDKFFREMPEETKCYICSKVHKEKESSVRTVFALAKMCILNNNFTKEFIDAIINQFNNDEMANTISKLDKNHQKFLTVMIELLEDENSKASTSQIHARLPDLSIQQLSKIITYLTGEYGMFNIEYKNGGRGTGRFRVLSFINEKARKDIRQALYPWEIKT